MALQFEMVIAELTFCFKFDRKNDHSDQSSICIVNSSQSLLKKIQGNRIYRCLLILGNLQVLVLLGQQHFHKDAVP